MTASSDPKSRDSSPLDEARLFELLEQPEHWPEDPAIQAELVDLLELHLALGTHGPALGEDLASAPSARWTTSWSLAAAAVLLLALVPAAYTVRRTQQGSRDHPRPPAHLAFRSGLRGQLPQP